jgi:ubiquinone/menaquinone biosynthesis C-methylase UbiE
MPIDFNDPRNRTTYADRDADSSWQQQITALVDPQSKNVLDIGCGGGVYTRAWAMLGAGTVLGIDASSAVLGVAAEQSRRFDNVGFHHGDARATGLPAGDADIVFERALIHLLDHDQLDPCAVEAFRLLRADGCYLIQDRTMDDVRQPASPTHLRGYLFQLFPRLLEVEAKRRPDTQLVKATLSNVGFIEINETVMWETRKTYYDFAGLERDLQSRRGRSILHEVSDAELEELIRYIGTQIQFHAPIIDQDRWTLWSARRPDGPAMKGANQ